MRRVNRGQLAGILAQLGTPLHVQQSLLGDYGPNPNTGTYDESEVFGCQGSDGTTNPAAYAQSANSLGMVQDSPADAPGFDDIVWSSRFYTAQLVGNNYPDIVIAADRNRVLLIVEKVDTGAGPVSINFGSQASGNANAPQGVQLYTQGSTLYVDNKAPTNDIHLNLSSVAISAAVVVVGTRGTPKQPMPDSSVQASSVQQLPGFFGGGAGNAADFTPTVGTVAHPATGAPTPVVIHPVTGQVVDARNGESLGHQSNFAPG